MILKSERRTTMKNYIITYKSADGSTRSIKAQARNAGEARSIFNRVFRDAKLISVKFAR